MHNTYEREGLSFIERGRERVLKTDVRRNVEIIKKYRLKKENCSQSRLCLRAQSQSKATICSLVNTDQKCMCFVQ